MQRHNSFVCVFVSSLFFALFFLLFFFFFSFSRHACCFACCVSLSCFSFRRVLLGLFCHGREYIHTTWKQNAHRVLCILEARVNIDGTTTMV